MTKPTRLDAEAMLRDAGAVGSAVRARAPQEHPLYVGMGLTVLLVGVAVDLNEAGGVAGAVGAVLVLVAIAVTVGTNGRYLRRHRHVHVRSTPTWVEWLLGLWSAAALFAIGLPLDHHLAASFTVGGAVGAVPFLWWADRLRRAA